MTIWQDDADRDLVLNAGPRLALLTRGEGSYLWDSEGRRHLDFLAGIAVTSLGHAHPVFVEAVSRQAATLAHVSNYFATPSQLALAARLKRLAGAGIDGRVAVQHCQHLDLFARLLQFGGDGMGQHPAQRPAEQAVRAGGLNAPDLGQIAGRDLRQ